MAIKKTFFTTLSLLGCLSSSFADEVNSPSNIIKNNKQIEHNTGQNINSSADIKNSEETIQEQHIANLEFHRGLNGGAVFNIIFNENISDKTDTDIKLSDDGYNLEFTVKNASIANNWLSNIDTRVFNTIVSDIKIKKENGNIIFDIQSLEKMSYHQRISGKSLDIILDRQESKVKDFNINEPITLMFKNAPLSSVLKVLADFAGLNLVISSSVQGNISIDLKDVPWNEVLNIILISKGLATKKMNNILYIATAAEINAQEQLEAQTKKSQENNAILVTEFIPLNYTTASAAQGVILAMGNSTSTTGSSGVLSSRGTITIDSRTNTLIVTDTEKNLQKVKNIIDEIDIPNDQVLIEARIVEVSKQNALDLGFNYGISDSSGKVNLNLDTFIPTTSTTTAENTGKLAYSIFGGIELNMEISALETEGVADSIASPHLIVSNNETAFIKQGKDVPYNQTTASGASSVAFQEAVLQLQATPQIAPDGNIILNVVITKNTVSNVTTNSEPILEKREITTKVMVKDGQTIVIGGIYEKTKSITKSKIPFLGSIPYLGVLFSATNISNTDTELLIFITPKIIERSIGDK